MISDQLRERYCTVVNAHGDADVDIVKTAVETSLQHTTTLIGDTRYKIQEVLFKVGFRST